MINAFLLPKSLLSPTVQGHPPDLQLIMEGLLGLQAAPEKSIAHSCFPSGKGDASL